MTGQPNPADTYAVDLSGDDLSLAYLTAELVRIDVLLHRAVRHWQMAGQDLTDAFRGQYVSDAEAAALVKRPFGTSWGQTADLAPEAARSYTRALARAEQHAQSVAEMAERAGQPLRLRDLTCAFDLDRFAVDALLICLAPALDLRYERVYGYLQDDVTRRRASVNLVLDLLCEAGPERLLMLSRFSDEAPLVRHGILERVSGPGSDRLPLLRQMLSVDGAVVAWMLGRYQPHEELGTHAVLRRAEAATAESLLSAPLEHELDGVLRACADEEPPIAVLCGLDDAGQRAAAGWLATRVGRSLLAVDLAAVVRADVSPRRAVHLALRDARLVGAVPYLTGWDACLDDGVPPPALLAALCAHPGLVVVSGRARWRPRGLARERRLMWLDLPIPPYAQRRVLWEHYLRDVPTDEASGVKALAGQFALTTGQIRDVLDSAKDAAVQRGDALRREDLFAAARAHSNPRLAVLAHKIEPRYGWNDIVLPQDQLVLLREIVATVRERPLVLDTWGLGRKLASSAGVTALFAGPPGTGKTMAAEVIAGELGLDLYKIDLSTVVSKYIGETEKNLERIFVEAENSNAILFFDEADALFGKRSEVRDSHDRYANIEISYLLQRMETYAGVTTLATNLRANLDEAFTRRLQFVVDFPFPEEAYRLRIWQALFPPDVPCDSEINLDLLARRFKLAGGNIRNIIVNAAYLAAADGKEVTMAHLLHGTRRELQKMGRLLRESDLTIEEV